MNDPLTRQILGAVLGAIGGWAYSAWMNSCQGAT